jgi:hypothetical protein
MAGAATTVTPNMVMKATEMELQAEVIPNTFWAPLTRDMDAQYEDAYMEANGRKSTGVLNRKTKVKEGQDSIEFGKRLALRREGQANGDQVSGNEEKLRNYENRVFFSDIRKGVPFDMKGLNNWTTKAFLDMEAAQEEIADWHVRYFSRAAWQGWVYGVNDDTATAQSAKVSQSFHPTVYMMESAGLARVTWSATANTYKTNINNDRGGLGLGDIFTYDRLVEAEIAMADNNIKPVRMSYKVNGTKAEDECWLWVYPRGARKRIKAALKDIFIAADVRGDANRIFKGDIIKCGKFLFCEADDIPRITGSGTTLTLQNKWSYSSTLDDMVDARTDTQGVVHALLGADALCMAEPGPLSFDFEERDYKYKKGIAGYRMYGFRRNETYDSYSTITAVKNQSSILLVENDG